MKWIKTTIPENAFRQRLPINLELCCYFRKAEWAQHPSIKFSFGHETEVYWMYDELDERNQEYDKLIKLLDKHSLKL
jgi:hypothetical protein